MTTTKLFSVHLIISHLILWCSTHTSDSSNETLMTPFWVNFVFCIPLHWDFWTNSQRGFAYVFLCNWKVVNLIHRFETFSDGNFRINCQNVRKEWRRTSGWISAGRMFQVLLTWIHESRLPEFLEQDTSLRNRTEREFVKPLTEKETGIQEFAFWILDQKLYCITGFWYSSLNPW